jgi:hypothetical protein
MTTLISTIIVVLAIKAASVPALILRATAIVNAMAANKVTFPSPVPALVQVEAAIATLTAAETAFRSRSGTKAAREDARKQLIADMQQLHAYVQQVANANPSQAAAIAENAAMTLKKQGAHHKMDLSTKQTVSGSVKVVAKKVKGALAHEWQLSTDGGKTWVDAPPSAQSTTVIHNLQSGVLTYFRKRVITKTGASDWSAPVSHLVS